MATGYTHNVADGKVTDFRTFAMQCARAFGATIMMRDDPADAPIPEEFTPDTKYHDEQLVEATARLATLKEMSSDARRDEIEAAFRERSKQWEKSEAERARTQARYEAMLAKVREWEPPSPDHTEMKAFMEKQLVDSIEWDCRPTDPPKKPTPQEWHAAEIERANWNLRYHTEQRADEIRRAAERTKWISDLRASLAATPSAS